MGLSERPVAIIISSLVLQAISYPISGSGLAIAKTIGFLAIVKSILGETISDLDNPINTSAPFIASSRVLRSLDVANSSFSGLRFSRSLRITPLLSNITILSTLAPKAL